MNREDLLLLRKKTIFSINLNGTVTEWSSIAQELYGYRPEEIIGTSISLIPEKLFEDIIKNKDKIIKGDKVSNFKSKRMLQDGNLLEITLSFAQKDSPQESSPKISCLIEEILPAKIDESGKPTIPLKSKETVDKKFARIKKIFIGNGDYLEDLIANFPDILFITEKNGKVLFFSRSVRDNLGFLNEDILGVNVEIFFVNNDAIEKHLLEDLKEKGYIHEKETNLLNKNRKKIPVILTASTLLSKEGKAIGFSLIAKDITEKLQKEEEIKYLRSYLDYTIEGIEDAVITVDFEKAILFWNRGAEKMFGIPAQEAKGKKIWDLFQDQIIEELSANLIEEKMLERNSSYTTECKMKSQLGSFFPAILSVSLLKDNSGNPIIGYVFVIKDITDMKRLEQQLLHSEKLASLGSMISGITHELNNKLGPVLGYSQLLKKAKLKEEELEMVNKIELSALGAKKVIGSLLGFSKQNKPELNLIDINNTIKKVISLLKFKFESSNLKLETDLLDKMPLTMVDENQMEQVLLNILNNAIQAIENKSGIISIRSFRKGETIFIEFSDNGPGIKEENLKMIFDPFFTTKQQGKGTGLGLSVCYGIIQNHNGKIYADSIEGEKTTFTIELPVKKDKSVKPKEYSEEKPEQTITGKRILLIDDDQIIRELMEIILKKDHRVESVNSGEIAIQKIKEINYDLIITDLRMPKVDGFKLYQWIKENKPGEEKKIIFITGDTYENKTKEFLKVTQNLFIAKPFKISDFENIVKKFLTKF